MPNVCRDENCDRLDIHAKHLVKKIEAKPHHRPDPTKKPLWTRHDPKSLTGAVARATSKAYPTYFAAVARDVRDDYGPCDERTVYRHLKKLVERGHLIRLDLGLAFAAYIRPKSRLLNDPESLRDYLEGLGVDDKVRDASFERAKPPGSRSGSGASRRGQRLVLASP